MGQEFKKIGARFDFRLRAPLIANYELVKVNLIFDKPVVPLLNFFLLSTCGIECRCTCTVFSPRMIQGMVGGRGLGVACDHIKAFGLFLFPHQHTKF